MMGNVFILVFYFSYESLQKPMYFFICNLAILDIMFINAIVPILLKGVINETNQLSVAGCLTQSYLYFLVGTTQFFLLDAMCFDRYLAICHPLRYPAIMHRKTCAWLVTGAWIGSFVSNLIPTIFIMKLSYCFEEINHFFCDVGPLLRNACTDTTFLQRLVFFSSCTLLFSLFVATISYSFIVLAILKINSVQGRKRAFSTCSSHALVVTIFFGSCIFMYVKPNQHRGSDEYDKKVAILNTVVVPLINPYIYTLRNKIVRNIIKARWKQITHFV
ncbi:olfactory receptor 6M1-like [Phyllobates terribilis]|uniref:olfactory receptor 6M1-like n=1 Tax=Phyllobates terribilis TaxID=111132 RepID=UPI003CCB2767